MAKPESGIVVYGRFTADPHAVQWAGVDLATNTPAFTSKSYEGGTNTVAEFLSLIHALALTNTDGRLVYTDSWQATYWVKEIFCRYDRSMLHNPLLAEAVLKGLKFLDQNPESYARIHNWDFHEWGLNPANFWRK